MLEQNVMIPFLKKFDQYPFRVVINDKEHVIGQGKPEFTVHFNKNIPLKSLLTSTSLALGEAYMNKDLTIDGDLYYALDHFLGQMDKFSTDQSALKKLIYTSVTKNNQKKEVQSHYDIGNDFYQLWLDDTMSYSCAYFKHPDDSLYQAQVNKVDYILEKLALQPGMSLLDIGCGWGFLLIEAAKKYGVKGTGITLSEEQYRKANARIKELHLEELVHIELMDYRDLPSYHQTFDRIVSVGMLEHVGRDNYALFIECAKKVLKPGGVFLLHFISGMKENPGDAWIKKYIFPGGVIPSLREMITCATDQNFHILDVENLRLHYNKTLLCWQENFNQHKDEILEMFDERFVRMWELYLASCAAGFHNGVVELHQILMTNGINNDLPVVRWY
ncbi:MAG TPA: cyclopropane-fatty-acyl-phospholipid synthase family protein [Enterococcus columbae]|nr:cyclopropane-fatty-acyl-phospholipid synthase family protein [Enterococcus columbae]